MKTALRKPGGRANLTINQLKEILTDVEVTLNNRPMEDDIESLPLTPNMLIHGANISLPEEDTKDLDESEVKRMCRKAKYIQTCKDAMWKRWTTEYIRSLRERRLHANQSGKTSAVAVGEIVLIKEDGKDRGQCKMGVIQKVVKGRDGVIRGAKLKTSSGVYERPVQLLCMFQETSKIMLRSFNRELKD